MKKIVTLFAALFSFVAVFADTETVNGVTYTYSISNGEETIVNGAGIGTSPAISRLTSGALIIPSTLGGCPVTTIGYYAFHGCRFLTSVKIPDGVKGVSYSAFYKCSSLTSVTIPDSVTYIDGSSFGGCDSLTSVTIPKSVTTITGAPFYPCASLQAINVSDENPSYRSIDGVLYTKDGRALIQCPSVKESFVIPEGVTRIGYPGFRNCSSLKSVSIPRSVNNISASAFENTPFYNNQPEGMVIFGSVLYKIKGTCPSNVVIPEGVTTIGDNAFADCDSLMSVVIPSSVKKIGYNAFSGCSSLKSVTIPSSVTEIGYSAFKDCSSLTSLVIPNGVTSIGREAFEGTPYYNNQPDGMLIYGSCLYKMKGECPSKVVIPQGVKTIGENAFSDCSSLTSVTIPNSVTTIENCAFYGCSALTSVTIPESGTTIGDSAFYGCSSLTSVTIPNSVTTIGFCSFSNCSLLTTVNVSKGDTARVKKMLQDSTSFLPKLNKFVEGLQITEGGPFKEIVNGVEYTYLISDGKATIGTGTYSTAVAQTTSGTLTIPSILGGCPVTTIGGYAFYNCSSLTTVTIPEGVTSIENNAFGCCSSLTSAVLPSSLITIGVSAFEYCNSLSSVTIPNSVTSIGALAFSSCMPLTSVTIPEGVTMIGQGAFRMCSSLVISVAAKNTTYRSIDGVVYTQDGRTLVACSGTKTSLVIPEGVTTIMANAFNGCYSLTSVTIPKSVTTIGDEAFSNTSFYNDQPDGMVIFGSVLYKMKGMCPSEVAIPDGVTMIGSMAFWWCKSLTSVSIPSSVKTIGNNAFSVCSSLTSVTIPDSVTTIGSSAFQSCSSLTSVIVSRGDTSRVKRMLIDARALDNAGNIRFFEEALQMIDGGPFKEVVNGVEYSYSISNGKATIGAGGYYSAAIPQSTFGELVIPSTLGGCPVTAIGNYAFYNCSFLTSVAIPEGVTEIGANAFYSCKSLTSVSIPSSVMEIGDDAFFGCDSLTSVTIPDGVMVIGSSAFYGCGALMSATIPSGVVAIEWGTFGGCGSLTSVTIPSNVKVIDLFAFGAGPISEVWVEAGDKDRVKRLLADSGFDVSSTTFKVIPGQGSGSEEDGVHIAFVVSDGEASLAEASYPTNGVYGRLPEARREGFTFAGWYTAFDGGKRVGAFSTINPEVTTLYARWVEQDASLYAQWAANAYTVNFNANGGSGAMAAQPFLYDQTQPLSANGFTKTGYTFKGWSTSPEGEVVFTDAAAVSNLTTEAGFTVALFAQWNKTVELDTDDISDWVAYDLADQYATKHGTNPRGYRDLFKSTFGNDYSAAFYKETGKVAADGTRLQVWHDYVAGTDPLDPESKFTASMTMVAGKPVISWTPELDAERAAMRKYTTYGKMKLTDNEWTVVEEGHASDYNFFKVTVEMK